MPVYHSPLVKARFRRTVESRPTRSSMTDKPTEKAPSFYGNIFQITRTPWDVTLHVFHGAPPLSAQAGTRINLLDNADLVARITLPVEVGKLLIKALEMATGDE